MTKEELQKSLTNIATVITKGRITLNGQPMTGEDYNQLFSDIKIMGMIINENEQLKQKDNEKINPLPPNDGGIQE